MTIVSETYGMGAMLLWAWVEESHKQSPDNAKFRYTAGIWDAAGKYEIVSVDFLSEIPFEEFYLDYSGVAEQSREALETVVGSLARRLRITDSVPSLPDW